jgi:hypothetical protein
MYSEKIRVGDFRSAERRFERLRGFCTFAGRSHHRGARVTSRNRKVPRTSEQEQIPPQRAGQGPVGG